MGWTPRQVDETSLWEFKAAVDGYVEAQGGEAKPEAPTIDEHQALLEKYG